MTSAAGKVARERLPGRPSSVHAARRIVRSAIDPLLDEEVVKTAELLASEVVTNAVVHAATDIVLVVTVLRDGGVLVEVSDGSRQLPGRREFSSGASTGRGLRLVDELADNWEAVQTSAGKTVRFEVFPPRSRPHRNRPHIVDGTPQGRLEQVVPVVLLDVPLRLHALWQEQAEGLLRDYLLATLDEDGAEEQLLRHAACSTVMSLLSEHLPLPDDATDDEEVCARIVMPVPREAVSGFLLLEQTIERAIVKADAGQLLAPATDLDVREFRRWVCDEVRNQARGRPPTAWRGRR